MAYFRACGLKKWANNPSFVSIIYSVSTDFTFFIVYSLNLLHFVVFEKDDKLEVKTWTNYLPSASFRMRKTVSSVSKTFSRLRAPIKNVLLYISSTWVQFIIRNSSYFLSWTSSKHRIKWFANRFLLVKN